MQKIFDQWFMAIRYSKSARANVFCFPWGGAGAAVFWRWKELVLDVNVWALKLPGRDSRIAEQCEVSAAVIVEQTVAALAYAMELPFVLYGHSMGAGLAFQVIMELHKKKLNLPQLFIASGRMPPHYPYPNPVEHFNDAELIHYLQQLGGIDGVIPHDTDFLKLYLPKIRADYALNGAIVCVSPIAQSVPISILNGEQDSLLQITALPEWQQHTKHPLQSQLLPGGHFFVMKHFQQFIKQVESQLLCAHL